MRLVESKTRWLLMDALLSADAIDVNSYKNVLGLREEVEERDFEALWITLKNIRT